MLSELEFGSTQLGAWLTDLASDEIDSMAPLASMKTSWHFTDFEMSASVRVRFLPLPMTTPVAVSIQRKLVSGMLERSAQA